MSKESKYKDFKFYKKEENINSEKCLLFTCFTVPKKLVFISDLKEVYSSLNIKEKDKD